MLPGWWNGRHKGLKIPRWSNGVPVRVWFPAKKGLSWKFCKRTSKQSFFCTEKKGFVDFFYFACLFSSFTLWPIIRSPLSTLTFLFLRSLNLLKLRFPFVCTKIVSHSTERCFISSWYFSVWSISFTLYSQFSGWIYSRHNDTGESINQDLVEEAISDPGYILYKQFCRFSCVHIYILAQIFFVFKNNWGCQYFLDSPFFVLKEFLLAPSNNTSVIWSTI